MRAPTPRERSLLRRSFALGDRVRQDRRNPQVWLVSSSTHANVWYRVSIDANTCGCEGFRQKRQCRHLCRISYEVHQQRKEAAIAKTA